MSVQKHPTGTAQGSRARRQNHSCDQCRKSKRACDALFSNVDGRRLPCSYCARTKKRCTIEWARSRAQSAMRLPRRQPHLQHLSQDLPFPRSANELHVETGFGSWDDLLEPSLPQELMTWEPGNVDMSGSLLDYNSMPLSSIFNDDGPPQEEMLAEVSGTLMSAQSVPERSRSGLLLPYFSSASDISTQQPADLELDLMYHQTWPASQTYSSPHPTSSSKSPRRQSYSASMSFKQKSPPWGSSQGSLSPFSIDQRMITASNCNLTSTNLLHIYHDVLEHNLSCWLTEMTCPYELGSQSTTQVVPEWGSSWSNRIYQRTIKLDRVAQSCKLVQLTHSEDQAASKALHLAIMAFATQWAQGSHRHHEKYPTKSPDHCENENADSIADEFDRVLQHYFWDQAQRTLQQVAHLESYRVVCAELIFGLTQRPWNPDNHSPGYQMEAQDRKFATDSILSQVHDIIRKEGPPIYMENAARKMHVLKYRCDALEKRLLGKQCGNREKSTHGIAAMSPEDRSTIGLLYWMAIMIDTVSSSMHERPVVVLDEDCPHESQKGIQQAASMDKSLAQSRWNLNLFVQGSLEETNRTHWPCSYEAAAKDVIKSAPVKVLLFRHVAYLQNAVRKSAHEGQIEDIIRSTMSLYKYWNKTHGAFFRDLVQNYNDVPQRIQGWFVCISAHWHLAALMLADLLEFVDENALGMEDTACSRIVDDMARRIRMHSARELSDLARVATPQANLGVPQMPDFHHVVNEGALLTEPWTMILIRAFTKACVIFLGEADGSLRSSHEFKRNMGQAEDCIKGLWLLGKKSDMARKLADTLSLSSEELRNECVV